MSPHHETSLTWGVRFLRTSQLVLPELLSPQLEPVRNVHCKSLSLNSTINIRTAGSVIQMWQTRGESGFRAAPACHSQRVVVPSRGLLLASEARWGPGRSRDTLRGERNLPQLMSQRGVGDWRPFGVTVSGCRKKKTKINLGYSFIILCRSMVRAWR